MYVVYVYIKFCPLVSSLDTVRLIILHLFNYRFYIFFKEMCLKEVIVLLQLLKAMANTITRTRYKRVTP